MRWIAVVAVTLTLAAPLPSVGHTVSAIAGDGILYVGGSGPGNYTRIQAAIDDAGDGATIYVYPGMYNESLVIGKSIALVGRGSVEDRPIVYGSMDVPTVLVEGDACTLRGLDAVRGSVGVQLRNVRGCVLENLSVADAGVGVKLVES